MPFYKPSSIIGGQKQPPIGRPDRAIVSPAVIRQRVEQITGVPQIQQRGKPMVQIRPDTKEISTYQQATDFAITQPAVAPIYKNPLFWGGLALGGLILFKVIKK